MYDIEVCRRLNVCRKMNIQFTGCDLKLSLESESLSLVYVICLFKIRINSKENLVLAYMKAQAFS